MMYIILIMDNSSSGITFNQNKADQNFITFIEILVGIVIASTITIITLKNLRISKRS